MSWPPKMKVTSEADAFIACETILKLPVPAATLKLTTSPTVLVPMCCTWSAGNALWPTGLRHVPGSDEGPTGAEAATTFGVLQLGPTHRFCPLRHSCPGGHAAGALSERQPFASAEHVCTCAPEQWVEPGLEQVLAHATHAFAAALQNRCAPQEAAADQARQPFASAVHVWTCGPEHCVAPALRQVLLQFVPPPHPAPQAMTNASKTLSNRSMGD